MTGIKIRLQKHVNRFQIMGRIIMALVIVVNADVNPPVFAFAAGQRERSKRGVENSDMKDGSLPKKKSWIQYDYPTWRKAQGFCFW